MGHRVHIAEEQLKEHLVEREWDSKDIDGFLHMIGRSALLSCQTALHVLEIQGAIDARIQSERDFDATFISGDGWGRGRGVIPQDFFEQRLEGTEQ